MEKRKRKNYTIADKVNIINQLQSGRSQADLAVSMDIPKTTIQDIWRKRDKIEMNSLQYRPNMKKVRTPDYPDVDAALLEWFHQQTTSNVPIDGPLLLEKASHFGELLKHSEFKASYGWLQNWKMRHGITCKNFAAESVPVHSDSCENWISNVWPSLSAGFAAPDIFSCCETGLFYKLLPNESHHYRNENCAGGKLSSKERICILLCANLIGSEKLQPLVVGKFQNPRCFPKNKTGLPVEYFSNNKARMTSEIFCQWLTKWDEQLKLDGRKILLLMDNCSVHPQSMQFENIKIVLPPLNATTKIRPMNQGIICNFKMKYRSLVVKKLICKLDAARNTNIDLLESILMLSFAWERVKSSTIKNCFKKALISHQTHECSQEISYDFTDDDDDSISLAILARRLQIPSINLTEYANVDEELSTTELEIAQRHISTIDKTDTSTSNTTPDDENDEDSESDLPFPLISTSSVINKLDEIKLWLSGQPEANRALFHYVNQLQQFAYNKQISVAKQMHINSYFVPQQ